MAAKSSIEKTPYGFYRLPSSEIDENKSYLATSENAEGTLQIRKRNSIHVKTLYTIFFFLLVTLGLSLFVLFPSSLRDPSLELWSPADEAVRYETVTFASYFFERSPYLGVPAEEKDALWADLYDFGVSGISSAENSNLVNATLPAPNDLNTFVIQLEVFHLLHCLNLLRKAIYPDEYPDGWTRFENGTVNHNTIMGFHWDHCIDALRQSIMCNADITPVTFVHNEEGDYNIFPNLAATHTCRSFDDIKEWAMGRRVADWMDTAPGKGM